MTGVTVITATLWPKRLELLRDLISPAPLIALLINPNNLTAAPARRELNAAAREIGQDVIVLDASVEGDFGAAFATLAEKRASALIVSDDALFMNRRAILVGLAARHAIPTIYGRREFASAGGLMSYGASTVDQSTSRASTSAVFSKARNRPICHSCSRPSLNWRSISRPRKHWASPCPRRSSRAPTR